MKDQNISSILHSIAGQAVPPEQIDLRPGVYRRMENEAKVTKTAPALRKFSFTIILTLLALLLLTTAVYAVYRALSGDPGLQSIQEAGLAKKLNATPDLVENLTATPFGTPLPAALPGVSQTLQGVTLTLDWVYLDEGGLALGFSVKDLPPDAALDLPQVTFVGVQPGQPTGISFRVSGQGDPLSAVYLSYQVLRADEGDGKLDLDLQVPLLRHAGGSSSAVGSFHFAVKDVPVYPRQIVWANRSYAVTTDGLAMRLESISLQPGAVQAILCADEALQKGYTWSLPAVSLQIDENLEISAASMQPQGAGCARFEFPHAGREEAARLVLNVASLSGNGANGPWKFYVELPGRELIASLAEPQTAQPAASPTPLGSQRQEGVQVSLDWVFVDAKRAAVGYTITGLPDIPEANRLLGSILLKDSRGEMIPGGYGGSSDIARIPGRPGAVQGSWSTVFGQPLAKPETHFQLDITLDNSRPDDPLDYFPLPPDVIPTPYPPGVFPPALPERRIGTFHFEFSAPVYPMQTLGPQPPVSANGLKMRLEQVQISPSYTVVLLCYSKPSQADWWIISNVELNIAGQNGCRILTV